MFEHLPSRLTDSNGLLTFIKPIGSLAVDLYFDRNYFIDYDKMKLCDVLPIARKDKINRNKLKTFVENTFHCRINRLQSLYIINDLRP